MFFTRTLFIQEVNTWIIDVIAFQRKPRRPCSLYAVALSSRLLLVYFLPAAFVWNRSDVLFHGCTFFSSALPSASWSLRGSFVKLFTVFFLCGWLYLLFLYVVSWVTGFFSLDVRTKMQRRNLLICPREHTTAFCFLLRVWIQFPLNNFQKNIKS